MPRSGIKDFYHMGENDYMLRANEMKAMKSRDIFEH